MVSSYLVCDVCGGFGPPASFLSENGLRLCYQCWYQERYDNRPPVNAHESRVKESVESASNAPASPDQSRNSS